MSADIDPAYWAYPYDHPGLTPVEAYHLPVQSLDGTPLPLPPALPEPAEIPAALRGPNWKPRQEHGHTAHR
ncbi:hypothetical protein [Streptomyces sp. NPDC057617]|uniref:hypothetical protein n=1 Tax=Streptomyces sp. NPDC057617 TaxID=3346184 RepID=UPI0036AB1FB1